MHCSNYNDGRGGAVLAMGAHVDGDCDNDDNGNGNVCLRRWQRWGRTHAGNESALQQRQQGRGCAIDGHVQGKVPHWQLAIGACTNGQWVQWGRHHADDEHTSQQQWRWQGRLHTGNGACGNSNGDGGGGATLAMGASSDVYGVGEGSRWLWACVATSTFLSR